ncbi:MAG TPA: hypothetical protein VGK59_09510 [Ohtaekwangia sp.]
MKTTFRSILVLSILFLSLSFQIIKTRLNVTIRNELGNTEKGVKVQLYEKEEDYNAETNPVAEGVTDDKGLVIFKELKPISYFILARTEEKDNSGGGEQTGKLEANRVNKVTVVIQ